MVIKKEQKQNQANQIERMFACMWTNAIEKQKLNTKVIKLKSKMSNKPVRNFGQKGTKSLVQSPGFKKCI